MSLARIVGRVAEGLDAVVEATLGEDERQTLEISADASFGRAGAHGGQEPGVVETLTLHTHDVLDGVLTFFVESLVEALEFGVLEFAEGAIEKGQSDEAGLGLIHSVERLAVRMHVGVVVGADRMSS